MHAKRSNPGYYWFRHGAFDCAVISDGQLTIPMPGSYGADDHDVNAILDAHFMSREEMPLDQNALFVDTGSSKILVDTGMGAVKWFGHETGKLWGNLAAAGIDAAEIDLVLLTHLHPDHCFGLTTADGRKAFPKARVGVTRLEYDIWTGAVESKAARADWAQGARKALAPYKDDIFFLEAGKEAAPGVTVIDCAGHSPGLVAFAFESEGKTFVNIGDAFHHYVIEPLHPKWEFLWDVDPAAGVVAKARMFDYLADGGREFLAFHFPWPGIGRLRRVDDHYAYVASPMSL